ncbi:MAG: RHS repeat-associated core domain-containing protein [Opitutaceae bacterium]
MMARAKRIHILAVLIAQSATRLLGQATDCQTPVLYATNIICESTFLPLELQGFSEYTQPTDPDEAPRKYLVERWSGVRTLHHVHSGGSFVQDLAFSGEWRFEATTPADQSTKTIDYHILRYATGTTETGSCTSLRTGINGLPGGNCGSDYCGEFTVNATTRGFSPTPSGSSCANGFGYYWTSEDTVFEELLEQDTEENAMVRAEALATTGTSSHSFANDFERNWDPFDRTRPVPFHAQKVRFFALFPPTCPGTYTVVYLYHRWAIGEERPEEPNHAVSDTVEFSDWSSRAPGPTDWIEIPLEKGMNMEIAGALIYGSCDSPTTGLASDRLPDVDFNVPLGADPAGNPYGLLTMRSPTVDPALGDAGSLQVVNPNPANVQVDRDTDGRIRSVRTPGRITTVTPLGTDRFRIDHYRGASEVPEPGTEASSTQEVSFAEGEESRSLRITEESSGRTTIREYRELLSDGQMELVEGDGLRWEGLERSVAEDGVVTETYSTFDLEGNLVSRRLERFREFPWGRSLVETVADPDGDALTATIAYYDDPLSDGAAFGQIRLRTDPTGHWFRYEYNDEGRISRLVEPFLNAPPDAALTDSIERRFTYASIPDLDGDGSEELLETIETRVKDRLTGRSFTIKLSDTGSTDGQPTRESWEMIATGSEADWDDPSNLKTVRTTIDDGPFIGREIEVRYPDGLLVVNHYSQSGGLLTVTTEVGTDPDEEGHPETGTLTVRTTDQEGNLLVEEARDIATGTLTFRRTATATDSLGRPIRFEFLDGSSETMTYNCCGPSVTTDPNGLSVYHEYDVLGRVSARTSAGIRTEYDYDADNRVIARRTIDPVGENESTLLSRFDHAGRPRVRVDAEGREQTTAYSVLEDGSRVELVTHRDGSTSRTVKARDGRPIRVDGTRQNPKRFDYGVGEKGFFSREIRIGEDDAETEWITTWFDFAARPYLVEYADGSRETRGYDGKGNLIALTDRDGVRTLFDSDPAGFVSIVAIDQNGNGQIDFAGSDRVTRTTRSYLAEESQAIERTTVERWTQTGEDSPEVVQVSDRWLTQRKERTTIGDHVTVSLTQLQPNGDLLITRTATDAPTLRTTWRDGNQVRQQVIGAEAKVLREIRYDYDGIGRMVEMVDSQAGSATAGYDRDNRLTTIAHTVVEPDDSLSTRTTRYEYDIEGRPIRIILPEGSTETRSYNSLGNLERLEAPRQPLIELQHDSQGRRTAIRTTLSDSGDTATTRWQIDPSTGRPTSREFPDETFLKTETSPAGRPSVRTKADGETITLSRDSSANLLSIAYSDQTPDVVIARDRLGRAMTITDALGTVELTYDGLDQIVNEARSLDGQHEAALSRDFDAVGRPTALRLELDEARILDTTLDYDPEGRVQEIVHQGSPIGFIRDEHGRVISITVLTDTGPGPRLGIKRNGFGEVLAVTTSLSDTGSTTLTTVERDPSGRITSRTSPFREEWTMGNDTRGWLSQATRRLSDGTELTTRYERDEAGNLTRQITGESAQLEESANHLNQLVTRQVPDAHRIEGTAHPDAIVSVNRTRVERQDSEFRISIPVDPAEAPIWQEIEVIAVLPEAGPEHQDAVSTTHLHRFTPGAPETFDYDDDGRLIRDGRWDYQWDAEDRLTAMQTREDVFKAIEDPTFPQTRLEFAYDSLNRRIRKRVSERPSTDATWDIRAETGFVYDGWKLVAELDLLDASSIIRSYAWGEDLSGSLDGAHGVGGLVLIHDHQSNTSFMVCSDPMGNIVALVDTETGEVAGRYEYAPYGEILRSSGIPASNNPIRFSSRYQDDETGLVYFGRRYYSPATGRWLSRDPLGEDAGPNLYAYAENDPVNQIDPIGENVYAVTRPLRTTGLGWASPALVHVYLAFDNVGVDKARWANEVQRLNQGSGLIDPSSNLPYSANPNATQTFSFHPDSIRSGDTRLNRLWTATTESSYVAYNDRSDVDPFDLRSSTGSDVRAYRIPVRDTVEQVRLYQAAIASRNINNYHPETFHPALYAFTRFNCGSWVQHILESNGHSFPLEYRMGGLTNLGVGSDYHMGKPMRDFTDFYDGNFEFFEAARSTLQNMGASIDILQRSISKSPKFPGGIDSSDLSQHLMLHPFIQ